MNLLQGPRRPFTGAPKTSHRKGKSMSRTEGARISPNMPMKGTSTSWGNVAPWYDALVEKDDGTYQKEVVLPNLMRVLDPKPEDHILDLACGQGFFAREIAAKGAKVTASDISKELIARAKAHISKNHNIIYHVSPAESIAYLGPQSVNKIVVVLAIQNIEHIQKVFEECSRVLKSGGSLMLVMNHPAFRIPKRSDWGWDDAHKKQYRRVDAYMSESRERILMNPGEKDLGKQEYTVSFHRPLQIYFKTLAKAGFAVNKCEEWISHKVSTPGARAVEENRARKEIPMFLMLGAVKL